MTHPTLALAVAALATAAPASDAADSTAPAAPASAASAASAAPRTTPALEASPRLAPLPRADAARQLPIVLQARTITSEPERQTVAEGDVEFRRGGLVIRADRLAYDNVRDTARASGSVSIAREGVVYRGPLLEIAVQRFEGFFLEPQFDFTELGAGGRADRIDFLGPGRSRATRALYTSCPRVDPGATGDEPDWVLKTERVTIDLDANEGLAEGAQLRFLGVPILALPALSFPINDARKSGWLPPSINIDNRSGVIVSVPWYWNIAPNRDATLAPRIITRRGFGLDSEFRYLEPRYEGAIRLDAVPNDQVARRSRGSLQWLHEGAPAEGWRVEADIARVSDDAWWKDFPEAGRSFTPRLLAGAAGLERRYELTAASLLGEGEARLYARALKWQVLQDPESFITAPYERSPQVGVALRTRTAGGLELALETEFNRFTLPEHQAQELGRATGDRWHAVGSLARPFRGEGWFAVPRLSLNAATYKNTERLASGLVEARRAIPTFSLDLGLELERSTVFFGRELRQTLEPRLLFVNTPYKPQSQLPNYDSAGKDFNIVSLFTDNAFSRPCAWAWCSACCCGRSAWRRRPTARPTGRRWSSVSPTPCWWAAPACCRAGPSTPPFSTAPTSAARCGPSSGRATRPGPTAPWAPPTASRAACRSSSRWAGNGRCGAPRPAVASRPRAAPPVAQAAARARGTRWAASTTACRTAGSPTRSSASSTTPAAGSRGSWASSCPRAAARPRRASWSSSSWWACRGWGPTP